MFAIYVIAAFSLLTAAWIGLDFADPFNDEAFDKTTWAANPGDRVGMAHAAIDNIRLGISGNAVIELLGQPDEIYSTGERAQHFGEHFPPNAEQTFVYWIGGSVSTSLRGLDDSFVYVHLGSGKVVAAEIGGG